MKREKESTGHKYVRTEFKISGRSRDSKHPLPPVLPPDLVDSASDLEESNSLMVVVLALGLKRQYGQGHERNRERRTSPT